MAVIQHTASALATTGSYMRSFPTVFSLKSPESVTGKTRTELRTHAKRTRQSTGNGGILNDRQACLILLHMSSMETTQGTIKLATLVLVGSTVFMCSCASIETRRFAMLNQDRGTIHFVVSGINICPLAAEGRWSDGLEVFLRSPKEMPLKGKREFVAQTDFGTAFDKVESGTILVDRDNRRIDVNVKYKKTYWWTRINGRFPIEKDE